MLGYLLGGFACALVWVLIGMAIGHFGEGGFLAMLAAFTVSYILANRFLPIQRWRWRLSRWWYRR